MPYDPLKYQTASTDEDLLPVVDEQDQVTGALPRAEVHARHLRHRAVHAVVLNAAGQVLLQLRSDKKDSHPGFWDISMGGHVDAGEEYEPAAVRELGEELGLRIEAGDLREVARRAAAPDSGWEFVRIYEVRSEGPFSPHPDEIDEVRWVEAADLFARFSPTAQDPAFRITGSGFLSLQAWGRATGRCPSDE